MRPRTYWFITMLALCHLLVQAQTLTNAAPPAAQQDATSLPDDPDQQILPVAQPEQEPPSGVPIEWEAQTQTRVGNIWTLTGGVVVHYHDYTLRADKVVYDRATTQLDAEGNLQVTGGPNDVLIFAS